MARVWSMEMMLFANDSALGVDRGAHRLHQLPGKPRRSAETVVSAVVVDPYCLNGFLRFLGTIFRTFFPCIL